MRWAISAALFCCGLGAVRAEQFGDFSYTDNGSTITITGYSDSGASAVEIPATINGKPVTAIGDWAFFDRDAITSISIPPSVTSIGNYAFNGCSRLPSLAIPAGVTSIGFSAFYRCYALTAISVDPANANFMSEDGVLFDKAQTLILKFPQSKGGAYSIPTSVTSIGASVFRDCIGLTAITLPPGVTSIGDYAFYDCAALTSVVIPHGVTSIGYQAFSR